MPVKPSWNPCCLGEKRGHFRDVSQCSVGGHLFIHSLDIEPWLWVIAQGIWDPGGEEGLGPDPPWNIWPACHLQAPCLFTPRAPNFKDPFQ